jgi:hypothetical protein
MTIPSVLLAVFALAAADGRVGGEGPAPGAPSRPEARSAGRDLFGTREAPRRPPAPVRGAVELSDGARVEGGLSLTAGKALELFDTDAREWREVTLEELAELRAEVRSERLEREWRWKEGGSDEKVYTGRAYPRRWLDHVVLLRDGTGFRGHLRGTILYVEVRRDEREKPTPGEKGAESTGPEPRERRRRFILRQYERGRLGETLDDLVYVKRVTLIADRKPPAKVQRPGAPSDLDPGGAEEPAISPEGEGPAKGTE